MPPVYFHGMLTHVAVDTDSLIGSGWPRPAAELDNLIASCAAAGIPVLVSSLTLIEAETIWFERTSSAVSKADAALNDLRRKSGVLVPDVALPTRDHLRAAYQESFAQVNQRWGWQ